MDATRCFSPLLLVGVFGLLLSSASVESTTVEFVMVQHLEHGREFIVVGSTRELGYWNIADGLRMTWNAGDTWRASTQIEAGSAVEFKAVVVNYNTNECVCWMPGPNRSFQVSPGGMQSQTVFVQWDSQPNANACSLSNVGPCSSASTKENAKPAIFSVV